MTDVQNDPARSALSTYVRAYERPADVTTALCALADHFPVVAPGGTTRCEMVPEGYGVSLTYVVPVEDDTYKDKLSGQTCFKAAFLKKLAAGLGLEWIPEATRRLDNFAHPFVCSVTVAGRYRDWSGEWRTVSGSYTLDLRDDAAHGIDKPAQLAAARKNIAQLAETKAKSRAIADACVSRTIAAGDIGRPIPMARLYRRAPIDPEAAKAALYGGSQGAPEPLDVEPRAVAAEWTDPGTGEVTVAPPPPPASPPPSRPAAPPRGPAPSANVIGKGSAGAGKAFDAASDEELEGYIGDLSTRIDRGEIAEPGVPAARAKLQRAIDEMNRRKAPY